MNGRVLGEQRGAGAGMQAVSTDFCQHGWDIRSNDLLMGRAGRMSLCSAYGVHLVGRNSVANAVRRY